MKLRIVNMIKLSQKVGNSFREITFFILVAGIYLLTAGTAYAAGDELLSFDSSLIIQFFIFVIAIVVLNKLLFKPLVNIRYRREELTVMKMEEARKLNEDLEKRINEYNNKIVEAREEANEQRAEIRRQAQETAEKIIADARNDAEKQLEKYKKELAAEVDKIKQGMKPEIESLADNIASKVLAKEV